MGKGFEVHKIFSVHFVVYKFLYCVACKIRVLFYGQLSDLLVITSFNF